MDLNWCYECREWYERDDMQDHRDHLTTYDE
jgi:hypothetical protein